MVGEVRACRVVRFMVRACRAWRCVVVVLRVVGIVAHRHGWQGGRDTPDEDSPYRARNLLKEEEEAKPATRDMPEMPVILPYSIHILPSILV